MAPGSARAGLFVIPFAPFTKPLASAKVALVTTGGVHLPDDERFDIDDFLGDFSYREIPNCAEELTWTHAYFADDRSDLDCVFPLRTMRRLAEEGVVGSLNRRHFSFMGAIHDIGPLIEESAPEVAGELLGDGVDAVLLTPS
ncbi:MAG: glycine/betaine/sarcosine/D-proline family reductase selenoprotein B [Actinomycetota bacterium]|nr:glycine/betaine/sarcosine/D-proline family reductase selenoprotein B [Actinomycetota bacterium]